MPAEMNSKKIVTTGLIVVPVAALFLGALLGRYGLMPVDSPGGSGAADYLGLRLAFALAASVPAAAIAFVLAKPGARPAGFLLSFIIYLLALAGIYFAMQLPLMLFACCSAPRVDAVISTLVAALILWIPVYLLASSGKLRRETNL